MLSGDDDGQPAWVRELGDPGDEGWFGPDSTSWQVHGSLATLVGGIRALLLQACHPLALAGVEQHSSYREDPLERLQRTNRFLTSTIFGSTKSADEAIRRVQSVHATVSGRAHDGRAYSASDPRLLMWVHIGLVDSMLVAAQTYSGLRFDADRYVAEMAIIGTALGVVDAPKSVGELAATLNGFREELLGSNTAREVAAFLQFPGSGIPTGAWPPYVVLSRAAVDLLPPWAAQLLNVPERSSTIRSMDSATCRGMLHVLQRILGRHSQAALLSYQRVGVAPP